MNIHDHFKLIIDKYSLNKLYNKFIFWSIVNSFITEGFYWSLLYFTEAVKTNPQMINRYASMLIVLLCLEPFTNRISRKNKRIFIREFRLSNSDYYNSRISNLDKTSVLEFNIFEYSNMIESFNNNYEEYISNVVYKFEIPIKTFTLVVISYSKKFYMLLALGVIFFLVIRYIFEQKFKEQKKLVDPFNRAKNKVINYITNSKNFIINNEFNNVYLNKILRQKEDISGNAHKLVDDINFKISLLNFSIILFVIIYKLKDLTPLDFLQYFLIIYDIQDISHRIQGYYEVKSTYPVMEYRLQKLNAIPVQIVNKSTDVIENITIKELHNKSPFIKLNKTMIINKNDHILIQGNSGSGKTTFLNILKGIVIPDQIKSEPLIENIIPHTYITLTNHKELFNGKLYDIVSNYDGNPNIDLINQSLQKAHIYDKLNENILVKIEELSSGERMRLLISRIIYNVKTNGYSILLFDELDENLNDELSISIIKNIKEVFNDKMIFYISHNNEVKKIFKKKMTIKNGEILFNW